MSIRHFLTADDLSSGEQAALVSRALELKKKRPRLGRALEGLSVGLLFEKPSTRTRVAFEVAAFELGAHPVSLRADELQIGRGETLEDTSRVLSRYLDCLVIRTFEQERVVRLAKASSVPVINGLTDFEHPCQALADVMTISERFSNASEVRLAWLGDGNNVCHSLLLAGTKAGFARIDVASPPGYEPEAAVIQRALEIGAETGTIVELADDPVRACKGATVLYTDVWASMGQEKERAARLAAFAGFQLSPERVADAATNAIVMHCLPAHRGEEIAAEVLEGDSSVVWDQAANRLHTAKAVLEWLMVGRTDPPIPEGDRQGSVE
jgi:ornithine carbamoyltransferase